MRDGHVTGVQPCALPIWASSAFAASAGCKPAIQQIANLRYERAHPRSEERRVGKECRSRVSASPKTKIGCGGVLIVLEPVELCAGAHAHEYSLDARGLAE